MSEIVGRICGVLEKRGNVKEKARAVLWAIREPTEAMIEAGIRVGPDAAAFGKHRTADRWRTMIDEALKE